jgi:alkylated DNA nucleotide flippase Atl1
MNRHGGMEHSIPCHRVIRSDGTPGGYAHGTKKKIALLKREGAINAGLDL